MRHEYCVLSPMLDYSLLSLTELILIRTAFYPPILITHVLSCRLPPETARLRECGSQHQRDARAAARALHDDTVAGNLFRRGTLFRTGNRYRGTSLPVAAPRAICSIYLRQSAPLRREVGFPLETLTRPSTRLPSDTEYLYTRSILEKPVQRESRLRGRSRFCRKCFESLWNLFANF